VTARLGLVELGFGWPERRVGEDVSLTLEPGEVLCLLGPNGGGKTTLFKTILGLMPPLAGRIEVDGDDTAAWGPRRRARAFGYVPQSGAGIFPFTVREMVLMGRTAHRGPFSAPSHADMVAAEAALERVGIAHLAPREWTRLSGGERQLALIARALAQEASVMLLDEPTASLDFGNQLRVLAEIRRLAESGLAVLFSTHHPEHAFAAASRVALLHGGRLARLAPPAEAITAETMRLLYDVDVAILPIPGSPLRVCVPRADLKIQAEYRPSGAKTG
jgi:iron complex transport system ATP-binding protein